MSRADSGSASGTAHVLELPVSVDDALRALADAAELWGADFERAGTGGRLVVPVVAGIRRGEVEGGVSTEPTREGSRLSFHAERTEYHLNLAALIVLLLGAAGGLLTVIAPMFPPLLQLLPASAVLMLLAWFLVLARIRNRNAADFFELVDEMAATAPREGPSEPGAATRAKRPARYAAE